MFAYQYIVQDNQETCINKFRITADYYTSIKAARWDWERNGAYYHVIAPYKPSEVTDSELVELLTRHERGDDDE